MRSVGRQPGFEGMEVAELVRKAEGRANLRAGWRFFCCLPVTGAALFILLASFVFVGLTQEEIAVDFGSWLLARAFKNNPDLRRESGLDDPDIESLVSRVNYSGTGCARPLEDVEIEVCQDDLVAGAPPEENRRVVFRKFVEEAYEGGAEGVEELLDSSEGEQVELGALGAVFDVFGRRGHSYRNAP
jgi:hypothetical protein